MYTLLLCLWLNIYSATAPLHKFYISITTIEFNEKESELEIVCELFIDDLEATLTDINGVKIKNSDANFKILLEKYTKQRFLILNKKNTIQPYNLIGYKIENDKIKIYLEALKQRLPYTLKVNNQLLTDNFTEQNNIVNITINQYKNTLLFNKDSKIQNF